MLEIHEHVVPGVRVRQDFIGPAREVGQPGSPRRAAGSSHAARSGATAWSCRRSRRCTTPRCAPPSSAYTSSFSQESCRNSNAGRTSGGIARQERRAAVRDRTGTSAAAETAGTPDGRRGRARPRRRSRDSRPQSFSRLSCVMRCGAFSVYMKSAGACASHAAVVLAVGIR